MGRTADSYLKEAGAVPPASYYDFAEWSDDRLMQETGHEMTYRDSMPHSPERLAQIERRIAHLVFEIEYRVGAFDE